MTVTVDADRVDAFQVDGAVALPGLLDLDWIQLLREAVPELLALSYDPVERLGAGESTRTRSSDGMWRQSEAFSRFLFRSPLGQVAAACMRSSSARLYEDLLLHTDAGVDGSATWHRDSPHWPLSGSQLSSIWLSLEPVTRDTGAMRFIAGSHLDDDVDADSITTDEAELGGRRTIVVETAPGDAIAFHPRVVHEAYGSAADRPRRTFTLRFTGDDVRWRPRRSIYHGWMRTCGLQKGDVLDHPWFPVVA